MRRLAGSSRRRGGTGPRPCGRLALVTRRVRTTRRRPCGSDCLPENSWRRPGARPAASDAGLPPEGSHRAAVLCSLSTTPSWRLRRRSAVAVSALFACLALTPCASPARCWVARNRLLLATRPSRRSLPRPPSRPATSVPPRDLRPSPLAAAADLRPRLRKCRRQCRLQTPLPVTSVPKTVAGSTSVPPRDLRPLSFRSPLPFGIKSWRRISRHRIPIPVTMWLKSARTAARSCCRRSSNRRSPPARGWRSRVSSRCGPFSTASSISCRPRRSQISSTRSRRCRRARRSISSTGR